MKTNHNGAFREKWTWRLRFREKAALKSHSVDTQGEEESRRNRTASWTREWGLWAEHLRICGCWSGVWGWVWMACCRNSPAVWTSRGHSSWPVVPADRPPQMPGLGSGWSHRPDSVHKYIKHRSTFTNQTGILRNVCVCIYFILKTLRFHYQQYVYC